MSNAPKDSKRSTKEKAAAAREAAEAEARRRERLVRLVGGVAVLAIVVGKLPKEQQPKARKLGLARIEVANLPMVGHCLIYTAEVDQALAFRGQGRRAVGGEGQAGGVSVSRAVRALLTRSCKHEQQEWRSH